jgi:hypothetical protein
MRKKMSYMTNAERRCLMDLLMVSDPWPLSAKAHEVLTELADKEAEIMGFSNWIEAYHSMLPSKV